MVLLPVFPASSAWPKKSPSSRFALCKMLDEVTTFCVKVQDISLCGLYVKLLGH
jgi:hypothetical protein